MNDYHFCVSLRIKHPSLDLNELTRIFNLEPSVVWKTGEPRLSRKGKPLNGVHQYSYWTAKLHDEEKLCSKEMCLDEYLSGVNHHLTPHKEKFKNLVNSGGHIEYFIGWFSEGNIGVTLEPELLASTAKLNIAIGLDIYAYSEE